MTPIVIQGIVQPDGRLELEEKVSLPPGRVQVMVQPLPALPKDDPFWQRMQAMWDAQQAAGLTGRSVEEVENERRAVREEWEERMAKIERIQQPDATTATTGEPDE